MPTNEHGECNHCGYDLNGDWIYDYFLEYYGGGTAKAEHAASMYGASKGVGRFGKAIYVKEYDEDYNKLPSYYKCPECGEKCYETA